MSALASKTYSSSKCEASFDNSSGESNKKSRAGGHYLRRSARNKNLSKVNNRSYREEVYDYELLLTSKEELQNMGIEASNDSSVVSAREKLIKIYNQQMLVLSKRQARLLRNVNSNTEFTIDYWKSYVNSLETELLKIHDNIHSIGKEVKLQIYKNAILEKKSDFYLVKELEQLKEIREMLNNKKSVDFNPSDLASKLSSITGGLDGHVLELIDMPNYAKSAKKFNIYLSEIFPEHISKLILRDLNIELSHLEFEILLDNRTVVDTKNYKFAFGREHNKYIMILNKLKMFNSLNKYLEKNFPEYKLNVIYSFHFSGAEKGVIPDFQKYGVGIISDNLTMELLRNAN